MPIYTYYCKNCKKTFDAIHGMFETLEQLMDHPVMDKWLQNMPTIMPRLTAAQSSYLRPAILGALQN